MTKATALSSPLGALISVRRKLRSVSLRKAYACVMALSSAAGVGQAASMTKPSFFSSSDQMCSHQCGVMGASCRACHSMKLGGGRGKGVQGHPLLSLHVASQCMSKQTRTCTYAQRADRQAGRQACAHRRIRSSRMGMPVLPDHSRYASRAICCCWCVLDSAWCVGVTVSRHCARVRDGPGSRRSRS